MTTPSTPNIDLNPHDLAEVQRVLKEYVPQYEVWAFGSRVTWTAKAYSDLDLAIITDKPLSLGTLADLKNAFDESDLSIKVDLVDWATTGEAFREIIKKTAVVVQEAAKIKMADWSAHNLEDCMEAIIDYRGKTPEKTKSGIPLITAKVVKGGRIEPTDEYIAAEDYDSWMRRGLPKAGDVVMTTEAPLGEIAQLGSEQVALAQRLITLRGKQNLLDNTFLKFLMQSDDVQDQLRARASGTTVLGIKQSELRKITLTLPPLDEQRAIAHILGTLDDKIELNRRMNETLEAMARALFKSWFVDFEPVRAKAEGRDTCLPKEIADLFPDSFEDSELGEVPKGWRVGTLAGLAELNSESWSKDTRPDFIQYVDLTNTKWGRIEATIGYTIAEAPSRAQRVLRPLDTIIGTVRPANGSYAFITDKGLTGSTGFAVLRPKSVVNAEYIYLASTSPENIESLAHLADGGAYPAVRPEVVSATTIILPNESILLKFSQMTAPLLKKFGRNIKESMIIAEQRDTLLPKLLSGEVRVSIKN